MTDTCETRFPRSVAYGCYAERFATRRRDKPSVITAQDYRLLAIKTMAIFNCTRIGVYKERFATKGRLIPEHEIGVSLLAPVAKNRS
jgi:hypothetical protein